MERYIVMRILFGLFLLFVVVFLIVRLATGGEEPVAPVEDSSKPLVLSEQNNRFSSVQYTVRGRLVAAEDHREIRYTISQNRRVAQVIQGYDGKVIDTISLPNTSNAYEELLFAIESEGFMRDKITQTVTESRGACATGRVYFFKVRLNGAVHKELWSASCRLALGTFGGDQRDIDKIFETQFPTYKAFQRGVIK